MKLRSVIGILAIALLMVILPAYATPQDKPKSPLLEFTFTVEGGNRIAASVFPADRFGKGRRMILFSPHIDKTDGNFYNASLEALHRIYGKKRGLFQLNVPGASTIQPSAGMPYNRTSSTRINASTCSRSKTPPPAGSRLSLPGSSRRAANETALLSPDLTEEVGPMIVFGHSGNLYAVGRMSENVMKSGAKWGFAETLKPL